MVLESFLESALLVLIVSSIAVALFKHLGLGSMLGLLLTGIIVGPYSPGPYVTKHVEDVRHFTELGIVLLLFIIGLEMKPSRLWAMRREVFGLGSLQIILSGLAIGAYHMLFQESWQVALLIGMAFALSSTAFVLQLLQERGEIASKQGRTAFSILLMQDMAIVPLLAVVPIISTTGRLSGDVPLWEQVTIVTGMLGLIAIFGKYLLPKTLNYLAKKGNKEGFLLAVLLAVFLAAWSMQKAGISMALGAFMMGILLSGSRYRLQVQASVEPYKGILMSLFFVAVGMSIDIKALSEQPFMFMQHVTVIIVIKLVILYVLALMFGYSRGIATRISCLLSQGGEFGFVLFGSAKILEVIDDDTFIHAIGVISISMLVTPVLVKLGDKIANHLDSEYNTSEESSIPQAEDERRVVIGGYGRVGHAVAALLHASGIPIVVFDTNPAHVAQGRKDGLPVYFGDIGDPELLSTARVDQAALVVLTIDQSEIAIQAVSHIRNSSPSVPIISRARDLEGCNRLMEAGATQAYPEAVESSLRLGGMALELINVPQENVDLLVKGIRSDNYRLIDEAPDQDNKTS
ncbi:MAG: portal protein [Gammaproteobacteria bacterium]|nr:portal protein [Gammaproteobacteria bacterium]